MSDEKRSFIKRMNASASMTMDIEREIIRHSGSNVIVTMIG